MEERKKSRRGFAAMSMETRQRIASMGGQAAHRSGKAHQFSSEEAREAGKKGGKIISQNRDWMRTIGTRGGLANRSIVVAQGSGGVENADDMARNIQANPQQ